MKNQFDSMGYLGLLMTVIFSLFYICYTFGWAFISGSSAYWSAQTNDLMQHLSGINLYISSPWKFPLLAFDSLNFPEGTSVTFVDGIPVFAFILKILLPTNIGFINPLGYWVALNFLLQGFAAWWITRELNVKSWLFLVFLAVALLTYPAWMDRLRQVALMSHWLILFAIALYIRSCRQHLLPKWRWTILIASSFYIHIYLFAMVFGIYLAAIFDTKQPIKKRYFFSIAMPVVILSASLFLFLLPLPPALTVGGHLGYAMDLLSPFYGGKFVQLQANLAPIITNMNPNYLGLGVIIIFLWVVFFRSSRNCETIKKHPAYFIALCGYFIYSLSDKVYFGGKLVAIVSYPSLLHPITTQFRAAERFFWPVGYSIVVFCLYRFYRELKPCWFSVIILLLLVLQCADVSGYYKKFKNNRYKQPMPMLGYKALDNILGDQVRYIYLYPKFKCNHKKDVESYPNAIIIPLMRYAAERHLKLNTGYIARSGTICNNAVEEIVQSRKTESAYIFSKLDYQNLNLVYAEFINKNNLYCKNLDTLYVCRFQIKSE